MWQINPIVPVKLIIGILAADEQCLTKAVETLKTEFGEFDLVSDAWSFTQTDYYINEIGTTPLRQFVAIEKLIDPGELAPIKHRTNELEKELAKTLRPDLPRPVNLDPGLIEPSKLILASTKNFSHRIYIGDNMYAEVTLIYDRKKWRCFDWTYPDYQTEHYQEFLSKVRKRLVEQLKP
ncbi:MAG TPA: DUF4416 family protein [Sedimentisphaerales bacterium]|nr:DUF4416 family protein [Sedimentisphaerales bacterium]